MQNLLNQIHCADCLDFMRQLPDKCVDLTVTSPPYDNLRNYKGYSFDFQKTAQELFRITKDGGIVVWIVGDAVIDGSESGSSFRQALGFMEAGFKLHDTMIYEKNGMSGMPCKSRYHQKFEYMFVFSRGKPKTFNPLIDRKNKWTSNWGVTHARDKNGEKQERRKYTMKEYGMRFNIWKYNTGANFSTKDKIAYKHPAIFPEKLVEDHISSWSNFSDLVFDPFIGSGTAAKMAIKTGRNFIGCDISQEYVDIANERISNNTGANDNMPSTLFGELK